MGPGDYDYYYYPEILQFTQLGYVSFDYCQEVFAPFTQLTRAQVCAGGDGIRDACDGDSGGPLMVRMQGEWYLLGLVSFGAEVCAMPGFPTVFSRVGYYRPWIESHTGLKKVGSIVDWSWLNALFVFFVLVVLFCFRFKSSQTPR